jgi:hypothetical protein
VTVPKNLTADELAGWFIAAERVAVSEEGIHRRKRELSAYRALSDAREALLALIVPAKALQLVDGTNWAPGTRAAFIKAERLTLAALGTPAPDAVPSVVKIDMDEECRCGHPRYVHMGQCHARDKDGRCPCSAFVRAIVDDHVQAARDASYAECAWIASQPKYDGEWIGIAKSIAAEIEAAARRGGKSPAPDAVPSPRHYCLACGGLIGDRLPASDYIVDVCRECADDYKEACDAPAPNAVPSFPTDADPLVVTIPNILATVAHDPELMGRNAVRLTATVATRGCKL